MYVTAAVFVVLATAAAAATDAVIVVVIAVVGGSDMAPLPSLVLLSSSVALLPSMGS